MTATNGMTESVPLRPDPALDVRHDTLMVTRDIDAPPSALFAAFADDEIRRRWYRMPGSDATYQHEFRIGGGEDARSNFRLPGAAPEQLVNRSRYLDIVEDRRIVFAYEAIVNDIPRWASLTTILLVGDQDGGTTLTWCEQVAFLARTGDGSADLPHLRGAIALRLNGLAAAILPSHPSR